MVEGVLFHPERLGNPWRRQALLFEHPRSHWRGFRCALPTFGVYAVFSGEGDTCGLTLLRVLQFDFRECRITGWR